MRELLHRALDAARRHPDPALSLDDLRGLVRRAGVEVTGAVLLRALAEAPGVVRIVDPWKGAWEGLSDPAPAPRRRERPGAGGRAPAAWPRGPWVVVEPIPSGAGGPPLLERLRASVAHLGWEVDAGSVRDMTRWSALVREAGRVRALRGRPGARASGRGLGRGRRAGTPTGRVGAAR